MCVSAAGLRVGRGARRASRKAGEEDGTREDDVVLVFASTAEFTTRNRRRRARAGARNRARRRREIRWRCRAIEGLPQLCPRLARISRARVANRSSLFFPRCLVPGSTDRSHARARARGQVMTIRHPSRKRRPSAPSAGGGEENPDFHDRGEARRRSTSSTSELASPRPTWRRDIYGYACTLNLKASRG